MSCQLGEGTGAGLAWAVSVGGQLSAPSAQLTAYLPPTVSSFGGQGAHLAGTPGSESVVISGANFGPLSTPSALLAAAYGVNASGPKEFQGAQCNVTVAHTQVTCLTAPGAGGRLSWSLTVDAQPSVLASTDYSPPAIAALTGPGAASANPNGGQQVTLTGSNFGEPQWLEGVSYGPTGYEYTALGCNTTVPHGVIVCLTAPGCGAGLTWVVTVRGQASAPSLATTSYASPSILAVTPASAPQFYDPASPVLFTLTTLNLPLLSQYAVFVQVGNGPPTLGPPYLRVAAPFLPTYPAAIAAATNADGSVNITLALPPPEWASGSGAAGAPPGTNLALDGWAVAAAAAAGSGSGSGSGAPFALPGGAGGQLGLRLLVLPAYAATPANASLALAAASGSYSAPDPLAALSFTGPSIVSVAITLPSWSLAAGGGSSAACPLTGPAWSCFDPSIVQVQIYGTGFAAAAPGVLRELQFCDDSAANCSLSSSWAEPGSGAQPPPPWAAAPAPQCPCGWQPGGRPPSWPTPPSPGGCCGCPSPAQAQPPPPPAQPSPSPPQRPLQTSAPALWQ